MTITANKFFVDAFAVAGDVTAVPDTTTLDGSVSYQQGFGPDYTLNVTNNPSAKPYPRRQYNQIMNDITLALKQYQIWGVPNFITSAQNLGTPFPYPKNAYALYDDGVNGPRIFQSLTDTNVDTPPSVNWALQDNGLNISTFTSSGSFVVPSNVTKIYVSGSAGGGGGGGSAGAQTDPSTPVCTGGGGGGGGGGSAQKIAITVTPGETLTVTIGAGGTAGAAGTTGPSNGGNGGNGGNTILLRASTPLLTLAGGGGGFGSVTANALNDVSTGGAGGVGGGGCGEKSFYSSGASGASGAGGAGSGNFNGLGGTAGQSQFFPTAGIAGDDATGYGSGGGGAGGAAAAAAATARAGAAGGVGAPGFLVIEH